MFARTLNNGRSEPLAVDPKRQRDRSGPSGGHGGCSGSHHPRVGLPEFERGGLSPSDWHHVSFSTDRGALAPGYTEWVAPHKDLKSTPDSEAFEQEDGSRNERVASSTTAL